jgi:hypothetical protein
MSCACECKSHDLINVAGATTVHGGLVPPTSEFGAGPGRGRAGHRLPPSSVRRRSLSAQAEAALGPVKVREAFDVSSAMMGNHFGSSRSASTRP